ncbi:CobW family GTP-binding protein [Aneurinibacillus sp. UBA3580]|jgi:G3E family GTPase|uniref:CobW family GTP-binding protein n=1 Tax=Aneurinibacillus sp. UBA3580 TaxID=1946041 RepID=UPI00257F6419|nr:GTP-binding protein [Aneurinibacillus sp. UBA3580]
MEPIPVIILSGFLGSGKTTLLLRLLQEATRRGLQPAVLMNELGTIDVDGRLVNATLQENQVMEKLLDGCICCSKKSEVLESIEKLLCKQPDVILVELTGVANPEEVVDMLTEPQVKEKVRFHKILTTLDSYYYLEYTSIFEVDRQLVRTVKRQVEVADIIIVNKTEDMKESHKTKLLKTLHKQNDRSPILFTTYSDIDLAPVFETISKREKTEAAKKSPFSIVKPAHKHTHANANMNEGSYSRVQTYTLPVNEPVQPKKVEKLLKSYHPQLLRAKGYLKTADKSGMQLMQYAAKRTEWEPVEDAEECYLVLIGIDLPVDEIRYKWNELSLKATSR